MAGAPRSMPGCDLLVDDLCLHRPGAGVSSYLRSLLEAWPADSEYPPRGFVTHIIRRHDSWPAPQGSRAPRMTIRPLAELARAAERRPEPGRIPRLGRAAARRAYDAWLRLECRRRRHAAIFAPNHLVIRVPLPALTTMHDLSVLEHPEWHPAERVRQWEERLPASTRATTRFITGSEFTRGRMVSLLGIDAGRIDVIPYAPRSLPHPPANEIGPALARAGLPSRYILHLGTIEPRKNIETLLDAHSALPVALRDRVPLVLAGHAGWGGTEFWRRIADHPASARALACGFAADDEVALLLAGAAALAVPSRYEGFGLPILEAMACGTAALCSDIPPFREIAAGIAPLAPPDDAAAWAAHLERVIEDDSWRGLIAEAGRARASEFTWESSARATAGIVRRVADAGRGSASRRPPPGP